MPRSGRDAPRGLWLCGALAHLALTAGPARAAEGFTPGVPLHTAADAPAPVEADALAFVAQLAERVRAGGPEIQWVRENVRPVDLPIELGDEALGAWQRALRPEGPVGARAVSAPIAAVSAGPAYARVVFAEAPHLSLVLRTDAVGAPRIDRAEPTSCVSCPEPERFVRDLLAAVAARGAGARVLVPGVDLRVDPWLLAHPDAIEARWVAAWAGAEGRARLEERLRGARVLGSDGERVRVRYGSGAEESWRVGWHDGRWQLDYAALAPTSPIALSAEEARAMGTGAVREALWSARWRDDGAAILLGERVLHGEIDPRDDTVALVVADSDGRAAAVALLDPMAGASVALHALSTASPTAAFALDAVDRAAWVAQPGRLTRVDLRTGELTSHRGPPRVDRVSVTAGAVWLADATGGLARHGGGAAAHPTAVLAVAGAPPIAARADGTLASALSPGRIVDEAACPAADAALSPDGDAWALACAEGPHAVVVLPVDGPALRVPGPGARAVAFSHDSAHIAIIAADGAVWIAGRDGAVRTRFGNGARSVSWSSDGTALLTVHEDGTARWWELARVRRAGP